MIMLPARLRPQPPGPGIFLAGLFGWLQANFLCVILGAPGTPDWYMFRHSHSYR